ncbi:MAG: bifunctional 5,10-methylenetetrahydrofolate dehydrogenase/5,10-methenyltetrahydrofolate cyclohydrolase, partial [Candidatus Omnitrophota bacterium]|nr:bifunctional 5,10-methylenetetrahydrofolate dehydrogenase/5,10-methenyltetrahydrofolate cyclohydrolase [Candidatus Omnitrophota bacterium]
DGRKLAAQLKQQLKQEVLHLRGSTGDVPRIINLMVGQDPAAQSYARSQMKTADEVGVKYELLNLPENTKQKELLQKIDQLNRDSSVNGVIIYKPVPSQIDYQLAAGSISASKDLEGINALNLGKMILGEAAMIPCTPAAVMEHIKSTGVLLRGKEAVVVGRSEIVGKPVSLLLLKEHATVTICHSATAKLEEQIKRADILVAAVGKPSFIKGAWIKPGAIVVDVGINQVGDKIVGDVEFDQACQKAGYITPVPGGVGPVTAVMLMNNAVTAYKAQWAQRESAPIKK